MAKKSLLRFLALLLAAAPLLGVYAGAASAATSRVAIIKSLTGTVQVKKAGGSKEFKAFARMSLNEGDVLSTSVSSTAVLQFANGTSEDDMMTVSANTTLTFSKLSDRNGTRTKVSMFNGNAWVDVKSIASKNDEFTLETPTAIMGVRGTHLMVTVDPATGETRLTVAAGIVNAQPAGKGQPRDVKPGDQALMTKDEADNGEVYIAPVDLDALMQLSSAEIIEAILNAASEIAQENEQKMAQYLNDPNAPGSTNTDELNRFKSNIENLLGAIVQSATDSGKVAPDKVQALVKDAEARTGFKVDLSKKNITLSEEEKRKQAEMERLAELQRQRAEQQKQLEEQKRKQQEDLLKRLEEEKKKKEEERNKALEEKRKQALDAYEKGLSDAEKARFRQEQEKRKQESSASSNGSSGAISNDGSSGGGSGDDSGGDNPDETPYENPLQSLTIAYHTPSPAPSASPIPDAEPLEMPIPMEESTDSYSVELPYLDATTVLLMPIAKNSHDKIMVTSNGVPIANYGNGLISSNEGYIENAFFVALSNTSNEIEIAVFPEGEDEAQTLTLQVERPSWPEGISWAASDGIEFKDRGNLLGNLFMSSDLRLFVAELPSQEGESTFDFAIQLAPSAEIIHFGSESSGGLIEPQESSSTEHAYQITLPEDNLYVFALSVTNDGYTHQFFLMIKRGNLPEWENGENQPFILQSSQSDGDIEMVQDSDVYRANVNVMDSEIDLEAGGESFAWIEAVEDVTHHSVLMPWAIYNSNRYNLPLDIGENEFRIYMTDITGHKYMHKLVINRAEKLEGISAMELVYSNVSDATEEDQVRFPLLVHDYEGISEGGSYRGTILYANPTPTVTDQVYRTLEVKFDPEQVSALELRDLYSGQSAAVVDEGEGYYTFDLSSLADGEVYEYCLEVNGIQGEYSISYKLVIVAGQWSIEDLDGWMNDSYYFEEGGPYERVVHFEEAFENLEFGFYYDNSAIEVFYEGRKLVPDSYGDYHIFGVHDLSVIPLTVKVYHEYHTGEPTVYTLTVYNGEGPTN